MFYICYVFELLHSTFSADWVAGVRSKACPFTLPLYNTNWLKREIIGSIETDNSFETDEKANSLSA